MNRPRQDAQQELVPKPALPPDAYNLLIRQEPERVKVPGAKDRDRKCIDPPPIVQLRVNDPGDPAQNYLQSPYFFMCCSLLPEYDNSSEPVSQNTLSGALVSSLHRLKDTDNNDGGFFVFGDLSVTKDGRYRLQFSLFEMVKQHVLFLNSIVSGPFTAFVAKDFPGMAPSTFLSRVFGDQGVKLKTRKEQRTLSRKRTAETKPLSVPYPPVPTNMHPSMQQGPPDPPYGSLGHQHLIDGAHYQEPAGKRQRTSIALGGNNSHEQEPRYAPSPYMDPRQYNAYHPSYHIPQAQAYRYAGEPFSATSSVPDYHFGHQRTDSSPASSSHVSPHTDATGYSSTPSTYHPMHHSRDSSYPHPHHVDSYQENRVPQLAYPTPPKHDVKPLDVRASEAATALTSLSKHPAARSSEGGFASERTLPPLPGQQLPPPSQPGNALHLGSDHVPPGSAAQFRSGHVLPGTAPQLRSNDVQPRFEPTLSRETERRPIPQPYEYQSHRGPLPLRGSAMQ